MWLKIIEAIFGQKHWELAIEVFFLSIISFLFFPEAEWTSYAVRISGPGLILVLIFTAVEKIPYREVVDD